MVDRKRESDLETNINNSEPAGSTGDYGKQDRGYDSGKKESIPGSEYNRHEKNNDSDSNSRMDHQSVDDDSEDTSQGYGGAQDNKYKY